MACQDTSGLPSLHELHISPTIAGLESDCVRGIAACVRHAMACSTRAANASSLGIPSGDPLSEGIAAGKAWRRPKQVAGPAMLCTVPGSAACVTSYASALAALSIASSVLRNAGKLSTLSIFRASTCAHTHTTLCKESSYFAYNGNFSVRVLTCLWPHVFACVATLRTAIQMIQPVLFSFGLWSLGLTSCESLQKRASGHTAPGLSPNSFLLFPPAPNKTWVAGCVHYMQGSRMVAAANKPIVTLRLEQDPRDYLTVTKRQVASPGRVELSACASSAKIASLASAGFLWQACPALTWVRTR